MSGFFQWLVSFLTKLFGAGTPIPVPVSDPPVVPAPTPAPIFGDVNFDAAFDYTIGNEGGYSNNPNDSGGPTNWGITIHDLSRWENRNVSAQEVRAMTKGTAKQIYEVWYWDILGLGSVKSKGVAMAMFDMGVVRGTATIAKAVQTIVGVSVDGYIGPHSLAAINGYDPVKLIGAIEAQAVQAFEGIAARIPKDQVFLKGWLARAGRLEDLKKYA